MSEGSFRVLVVTNMWPGDGAFHRGMFVRQQVEALRREAPGSTFDVEVIGGNRGRADYLAAVPRLRRALARGYDLVHAHYGLTALTVRLARGATPYFVTLHGDDVNIGWQRAITRVGARRAARILVASRQMNERLSMRGSEVLPSGARTDEFRILDRADARRRLGIPLDAPVVLFPADPSGSPVKNYPLFAAAIESLPAARKGRVIVQVLKNVPDGEVPWVMAASDVVALTSHSEGSPMVVKEALAAGVPVVAVDVGDVSRVLEGVPGCAVVPHQPGPIAAAIEAVLARGDDGQAETRRRRIFEQGLDERSVAAKLISLYRSEMNEGR